MTKKETILEWYENGPEGSITRISPEPPIQQEVPSEPEKQEEPEKQAEIVKDRVKVARVLSMSKVLDDALNSLAAFSGSEEAKMELISEIKELISDMADIVGKI